MTGTDGWSAVPEPWVPLSESRPVARRTEEWNWFGASAQVRHGREGLVDGPVGRRVARVVALIVLILVTFVIGSSIVATIASYFEVADEPAEGGGQVSREALMFNAVALLVLFGLPPLFWVFVFYRGGHRAWRTRLFLRTDRLFGDFGWGVIGGFGMILGAMIVSLIAQSIVAQPENEVVEQFGRVIDWRLVFLVAISAGVAEEIFFRGFLQPRIGIVPANVLFGLVHLSYGTPLQVIIPMVMGFVFSWMTIKRGSLFPAIVAHFTFDLIMLSLAKLYFG